jgi:hypothetical protein
VPIIPALRRLRQEAQVQGNPALHSKPQLKRKERGRRGRETERKRKRER